VGSSALPPIEEPRAALRVAYQARLDEVDDGLVGAALLVGEAFPRVTRAFLLGDRACVAEMHAVNDAVVERVRRVEEQGFLLLARESPVAGDLRRLVSILRLVTAVERSAALLRHVAEAVDRIDLSGMPADVRQQVDELGQRAGDVFRRGVDAWRTRDGLADRLTDTPEALALGLLARYWERIADHGVSFAQHSTFAVTGERVDVGR
jgi:phosphate transport system protein